MNRWACVLVIVAGAGFCGEPAASAPKDALEAWRLLLADYPEDILLEEKPFAKQDQLVALLKKQGESAFAPLAQLARTERSIPVASGAAYALGEMGNRRAVSVLLTVINERQRDFIVTISATRALGRIGDPELVPALLAKIDAGDTNAEEVLKALKHAVHLKPLLALLKHKDLPRRVIAVEALANYTDKEAVDALIAALKDENEGVNMLAARSLGTIGDATAVPALRARLASSSDIFMRKHMKDALDSIASKAGKSLLAARKIKPGKEGVPQLIEALKEKDPAVRKAAAAALGDLFEHAAPAANDLLLLLKDADPEIRDNGMEALVSIGPASLVPLADSLAMADVQQLDKALAAMFRILFKLEKVERGDRIAAKLIPIMEKGPQMASGVHTLLIALGPDAAPAVPKLIQQIDNADASYARGVVFALGSIGQKAVPDLITALKSKNSVVRKRAAYALSVVGVSGKTIISMRMMGDSGGEFLERMRTEKNAVDAVPALIEALKDEDTDVRYNAVVAFRRMKDDAKPALPALRDLQKDPNEAVRKAVATTITAIQAPLPKQ